MTLKNLYISTGILAVLAVITYFIKKPDTEVKQDPRVGNSIVDAETLRNATQIQLSSGDESVTITNRPDDKAWVIEERSNMPVDFPRLSRQIGSLLDGKLQKLVSTNPERIATFGFESGDSITLRNPSGDELAEIELGKVAEGGRQFLRFKGEDKAFLITNTITLGVDSDSWLDKKLVEFTPDEIESVAINLPSGESIAARRAEGEENAWEALAAPEGKQINGAAIDRLVSRLSTLTFTATNSPDAEEAEAARKESRTYELTTKDSKVLTYRLGQRPEIKVEKEVEKTDDDGNTTTETEEVVEQEKGPAYVFIASSEESDAINAYMEDLAFEVAEYHFTSLPSSLDDLLEDLPEPEPKAEAENEQPAAEPEPAPTAE